MRTSQTPSTSKSTTTGRTRVVDVFLRIDPEASRVKLLTSPSTCSCAFQTFLSAGCTSFLSLASAPRARPVIRKAILSTLTKKSCVFTCRWGGIQRTRSVRRRGGGAVASHGSTIFYRHRLYSFLSPCNISVGRGVAGICPFLRASVDENVQPRVDCRERLKR